MTPENKSLGPHGLFVDNLELEQGYVDPAERRAARERTAANLQLIWGRRLFLFKAFICGMAIAILAALLLPPRYESVARLMPPDQQPGQGLAMLSGLAGQSNSDSLIGLASSVLGLKTSGDLFIGVLGSRTVQDAVVNKFDLRKVYGERDWDDARKKLASRTDLSTDRKSGIITITVSDRSPRRAAAMTQEYIDQLNQVITEQNTSAAHRERVFLEQRLGQVRQDLEVAETNFSDFASKNAALDIPAQGKATVAATASLEGELIAAQTELQGLKQVYADNNVRVRSTEARIDELRQQLEKLSGQIQSTNNGADQTNNVSLPSFQKLPLLGVSYADLLRNAKVQEVVFELLTREYEMAKVEEAKETPSVKVLDPPDIPERKSFPPRILITISGGIFFVILGVAWIESSARWDRMDPQDPMKLFARKVIGDVAQHLPGVSTNGSERHMT